MPIITPEKGIHRVLEAAGLAKPSSVGATLKESLDESGLSIPEMLDKLSTIIQESGADVVKLNAIEKVLKMHGALKENQAPPPVPINIIINDPHRPEGANPILFPRELITSERVQ